MKRQRRKPRNPLPPIPRPDLEGRRAELELFSEAFGAELWRRPTPL